MNSIQALRTTVIAIAVSLVFCAGIPGAALAVDESSGLDSVVAVAIPQKNALPALQLKDALVLEDREGYNSEYIFGMTKAIVNSTLHPALKPLTCLITVPLDLVALPFAALIGAL